MPLCVVYLYNVFYVTVSSEIVTLKCITSSVCFINPLILYSLTCTFECMSKSLHIMQCRHRLDGRRRKRLVKVSVIACCVYIIMLFESEQPERQV